MRYALNSLRHLLVVGTLALAVVACSGDAEPTNTPANPPPTDAPSSPPPTNTPASPPPTNTPTSPPPTNTPASPPPTNTPTSPPPTNTPASPPPTSTPVSATEPLSTVASIYPMQYFAERVGGDRVNSRVLVPPGAEAHGFELTPRDIRAISEADVVAMNGLGLELWMERVLESLGDEVSGIVVEAAYAEAAVPFADEHGHGHEDEHAHEDEHGSMEEDEHGHIGRLLVADGVEASLSVIDLGTGGVESGIFEIAGPNASIYPSLTHRYGFVLARGPESGDDRIHIFDGGVFYVPHGDHYDLISEPVSRHSLEIVEEWPVHSVNSHGWTAIFADTNGHVILINEEDLASSRGDYEPIVLEAGIQHGTGFAISDEHVIMSVNNPLCTEFIPSGDCLPLGVVVRTFDNEVVYDAANNSCPGLHGESHNAHGAVFGCFGGVLFVQWHDGQYEHEIIPYPEETGGEVALGLFYGHRDSDNFFAPATIFPDGECCELGGVWLVDVVNRELREVIPEPSVTAAFSSDGETFYTLAADGVLRAVDSHDGELVGTMQLVGPFERVFGRPSPSMIVVGEMLFLADPNSGHVLGVHLEHMEIEEEWRVGGSPSGVAFVGVLGESEAHEHEDEHAHEDEDEHHEHDHGEFDPHFWLDPLRAIIQAERIAEAFIQADPEGADFYRANLAALSSELRALHVEFEAGLRSCAHREFVTSHSAYGYIALAYDLEQVGVAGLSPETEPSAQRLASIADRIKDLGITAVLLEPVLSGANIQSLARETGAGVYPIHAIESVTQNELDEHGDYFGLMRDNLNSLRAAMECS